jgi:replicative DNA helicase
MSLKPTRPLPAHEGAEKLVLGALLLSSAAIDDVMSVLRPDDFSDVGHASIWAAMQELHAKRHPVDLMTVAEKMRSMGTMPRLTARSEDAYIVELMMKAMEYSQNSPLGALDVEQTVAHAKLVQDASRRRSMILLSAQIVEQAYAGTVDSGTLTERFQAGLGQLADRGHAKVPRPFRELLHSTIKKIEQRFSAPKKSAVCGIPTGLQSLDDITQGYQPSEVFVLGARPSMGKTSLVLKSIFHAAEKGFPVLAFSLEMSDDETALRALASQAGVNSARLKTGIWNGSVSGSGGVLVGLRSRGGMGLRIFVRRFLGAMNARPGDRIIVLRLFSHEDDHLIKSDRFLRNEFGSDVFFLSPNPLRLSKRWQNAQSHEISSQRLFLLSDL